MNEYETVNVKTPSAAVRWITIQRPEALNALSSTVIEELLDITLKINEDPRVRVVVLEGAVGKAFVAGADISEMSRYTADQAAYFAKKGQRLTHLIEQSGAIFVAKVNGFALGGGCELAMACDIIYATENSKFAQPETGLGLIPGFGGTQRLIRRVGKALAMDMICGGRILNGQEAAARGLISKACPSSELDSDVNQLIRKILKCAPQANASAKEVTIAAEDLDMTSGLAYEAASFANCFARQEAKEGLQAFLEKKPASFLLTYD